MPEITASLVKDLREKTGAGMMDCKKALDEAKGDMEAAIDWLRKKGISKAAKKAGRAAAEGLVGVAVDANTGVLLEVNAETDFVARNDEFNGKSAKMTTKDLHYYEPVNGQGLLPVANFPELPTDMDQGPRFIGALAQPLPEVRLLSVEAKGLCRLPLVSEDLSQVVEGIRMTHFAR